MIKADGPGSILVSKKLSSIVVALFVALVAGGGTSSAGEVDKLVDKLVEKGILTRNEAQELALEMQQEAEKQKAEEKQESMLPEWVGKTKLSGDLRLRYQYEERDEEESRERGRYRLRIGVETEAGDTVKIGFGLATGSGDPRSTNQTFTDSFEKPEVRIDYAFGQWQPIDWFKLTGGKMHNPLYRPSDLLWDSDITPEGIAAQILPYAVSEEAKLFLNTSFFVIDERSSNADPYMYVIQPGVDWNIVDTVSLKLAAAHYGIGDVQGKLLDYSEGTNTLSDGGLAFEYSSYGVGGQLAIKDIAGFLPYLAFFAEYINNPDPDDDNDGYIGGFLLGHEKLAKLWDWQFGYSYRRLEKDAWLDTFPDSDFFGGATGAKGSEALFNLGLAKNISLGLDYYHTEDIEDGEISEDLFQADLVLKF